MQWSRALNTVSRQRKKHFKSCKIHRFHFWATVGRLSVTLVYCGQTVGLIKMKLGMEVGLIPGHIVLDEDTAPPPLKGAQQQPPPLFGSCLL